MFSRSIPPGLMKCPASLIGQLCIQKNSIGHELLAQPGLSEQDNLPLVKWIMSASFDPCLKITCFELPWYWRNRHDNTQEADLWR
jgi:hypothetical protein